MSRDEWPLAVVGPLAVAVGLQELGEARLATLRPATKISLVTNRVESITENEGNVLGVSILGKSSKKTLPLLLHESGYQKAFI